MKTKLKLFLLFITFWGIPALAQSSVETIQKNLTAQLEGSLILRGMYDPQSSFSSIAIAKDHEVTLTGTSKDFTANFKVDNSVEIEFIEPYKVRLSGNNLLVTFYTKKAKEVYDTFIQLQKLK